MAEPQQSPETWAEYLPTAEAAADNIDAVVRSGALAFNSGDYITAHADFAEAARMMAAVPDSPDGRFSDPLHKAAGFYDAAVTQLEGEFPLGAVNPILVADSHLQEAAADLEAAR
ncbi:MAG: hypothetical protein V9E98_14910 [Candidatus Nanopelagicales bacterium]